MTEIVNMTRDAFFQSVLEEVRQISITDLIRDKYEIPAGVCPFHEDKTPGSFSTSDRFRKYTCWSCGATGDVINFIREFEEPRYPQAVMKLAVMYDLITLDQAEAYFKGTGFEEVTIRKVRNYTYTPIDNEDTYQTSPDIIHDVLSVLAKGESILTGDDNLLSETHFTHLKEERGMDEEMIRDGGFFTMPSRTSRYLKAFFDRLKSEFGYEPNIVEGVPGFYKKNNPARGHGYMFATKKGFGIPIRDADGRILGIQIRKDAKKKGESRYVWLSSSFANEEEDLSYGTGSGSPIHVSYPKVNRFETVAFLTEGYFKAEAIARTYHSVAMSLQGILNWKKSLYGTIETIEELMQTDIKHFYFAFDSDIRSNIHVYEATREMIQSLHENEPDITLHLAWWDGDYGKGIDDLIMAGHQKQMMKVDALEFVERYDKAVQILEERLGMDVKKAIKEFGNDCLSEVFDELVRPMFEEK
ncbi:CHC2 zinc finger domain-containing protein [Rossellomorea marisflavi]|uniref:CHC2 zinc finger domain-containing protein n=1 Tax=Rossellomorea marisflavi TaxID=189381 RepID=UPI003FA09845